MIRKLLVANRGEIAVRIVRTAHSMGISTVAVYSATDRHSMHAALASEAMPVDSYLNEAAIVEAARNTGADAIHPGYGFLAENADFAEACERAGLVFVGPPPGVIRRMGAKDAAREIAIQAGVPVVPASDAVTSSFPMLIKASAGGGGRGMRIVRAAEELPAAVEAAGSEAQRAFGNDAILFERYIENARHVEVQIFGDHHGNLIHLFERDCSVQRRYQKVMEESPSPALTPETREQICAAAVALGKAIGYTNAGTVEFLLAPSGEFFFIEVNTRIQVEHPVTEMTTGLDLVRLQIEVAEGRPLNAGVIQPRGHAIEARLYAEQPANHFLPSAGTLDVWRLPEGIDGLRIDTGVGEGSEIGVQYDPLLAKLIVWAPDRASAIRKLSYALRSMDAGGVETNREYLITVLESEDFQEGRAHTAWALDYRRHESGDADRAKTVAAFIARQHSARLGELAFYRNNPGREPSLKLEVGARTYECPLDAASETPLSVIRVSEAGGVYYAGSTAVRRVPRFPKASHRSKHETANSPMPGLVLRILVAPGQIVRAGQAVVVLEAMKMEQTIRTTIDGLVGAILVKQGQVVAPGQVLVEIVADSAVEGERT